MKSTYIIPAILVLDCQGEDMIMTSPDDTTSIIIDPNGEDDDSRQVKTITFDHDGSGLDF